MDIETVQGKKVDVADVSTVSLRDMYMRICACRDFEISHVWHRAIFLTAFLLGCFTAYGFSVDKFWTEKGFQFLVWINAICFAIALVGIVISILWICLAKGSKAWQEVYETAIKSFSIEHSGGVEANATTLSQFRWRKLIFDAHAKDPSVKEKRNSFILSLQGGAYSVSKIVIFIGVLSMFLWTGIAAVHVILCARYCSAHNALYQGVIKCGKFVLVNHVGMSIALCVIVLGLPVLCVWWLKSGALSEKDSKNF